jgi:23S rRNA (cytidine1920-2'-O)/16S rRNA (cytidine1409-2'-O)-methyltransferase
LVATRAKAQALILAGRVTVDGKAVIKAGHGIKPTSNVQVTQGERFVSRGGEKLEGALTDLALSPTGRVCLDVGASTGGFTDCLLQHGAERVYAVDVGTHQLADSLRSNPRVVSIEQKHILDYEKPAEDLSFVVIDASFISLKNILAKIHQLAARGADILAMVKPQFEVGPQFLKKGVVRDTAVQHRAVDEIIAFAKELDFEYVSQTLSRLKGPKGNQEYFVHLKKK